MRNKLKCLRIKLMKSTPKCPMKTQIGHKNWLSSNKALNDKLRK